MKNEMVFGLHSVESLLQKHPERITRLCVQKERHDKKIEALLQLAKNKHVVIEIVDKQTLSQWTSEANHQGIVAFCVSNAPAFTENDLSTLLKKQTTPPFLLILDGVQDPHNLGACLRSADAAGVQAIIAPKDKSVGMTPTVSKVACGAAETVPFIQVTNLVRTIEMLKEQGIWIYGAAGEAEQSLYGTNLTGPLALILGAEGSGLRRLTKEHCDGLIKIPMQGTVASLNISVAAGIFLFEAVRQRHLSRR